MIKSIELTNWKTHKRTVMNFQKGVNVLIGVMGAGKSSVIDGISFGLFGTFPSLNQRRTNTENLISNRPSVQSNAEVKIKFTVGSDEYTVTRKISKKETASANLEKNGSYLQTQSVRVNEEIESLLKLNYDTFSRAIYAEQNRVDYFIELTRSERKKQIDQMLGLDNFATAEQNATSLANSIKSMITEEEQILAQSDVKELKVQLEKLSNERQAIEKEQLELKAQSKEKESNKAKLEKELADVKSRYEKSKKLEKETAELSSKIETLRKELKKIEELGIEAKDVEVEFVTKSKKLESHDGEIKKFRKEESDLTKMVAESEAIVKLNEKKAQDRQKILESLKGKDIAAMEKALKLQDESLQSSIKELSSLKGRKEEIKKRAQELSEHISKCPVCERALDEPMRKMLLDQKNNSLKELDLKIKEIESQCAKADKYLLESKKEFETVKLSSGKLADYKDVDELLEKHSKSAKEHISKQKVIIEEIEKYTKERDKLNKELSEINSKRDALKRKEKYELEIKESSETLEKRSKEIKDVNFDEKNLYKLQELITKESSLLSDVNGKIQSNERYVKSVYLQIEDKTKAIANLNSVQERIENSRNHLSNVNKFRNALVDTEAQLRNNLVTSINALMQNIWSELYPYADYSSIRLNAKKDDYALEASVISADGGQTWIEIEGIASGGERSIASLTMRIALAMVIVPNLRWLILDEPTHNIDENGIAKFIEVLGNSLPKVVEQIFIITHDNALKNISSARVYQLERNKDRNEYTSVVES
jgi:DNA repair protein SbcC/Rad50